MPAKERVVSGVRPTGRLHLGHLHGVLKNWVKLQDDYECFFFIADWHGLTTEYENPKVLQDSARDILADWLAAGVDPKRSTIFLQSDVKEHAELYLLLGMMTPISWLERVPSFKDIQQELKGREIATHGFLGYPLLQTADVILYDAKRVPVGKDQVPHLELSREIVRRFNFLYREANDGCDVFTEPLALLTESPKILGADRRKMSKSYNNCIYLSDTPEEISSKVNDSITDPSRKRRSDPGDPDICLIYDYHKLLSDRATLKKVGDGCRNATLGCVDDKKAIAEALIDSLRDHQARRNMFMNDSSQLDSLIKVGSEHGRDVASQTMARVRKVMKVQ